MRTFTPASWGKMLLASAAVLLVGGPGFVLAGAGPNNDYVTPRTARLLGPPAVAVGSTNDYDLQVFFQDGSSSLYDSPPATFTKTLSISGGNGFFGTQNTPAGDDFTATSTGFVVLKGTFTNAFGTVEGTRRVRIHP
jgi:hypothetical protein